VSGRRAVFLDRDGVLNRSVVRGGRPFPPDSAADLEIFPGAAAAVERLRSLGLLIFVVTNQPDVGRGTQSREAVEEINAAIGRSIAIDEFFVCYHDDADHCDCRKPAPGLLIQAAKKHSVNLAGSYLVGDRWRDVEAGAHAGCRTVWIDFGYREKVPSSVPDARVKSIEEAADWIAASEASRGVT